MAMMNLMNALSKTLEKSWSLIERDRKNRLFMSFNDLQKSPLSALLISKPIAKEST
jgi:hypothetical protein